MNVHLEKIHFMKTIFSIILTSLFFYGNSQPPSSNYELVFEDEFNSLDNSIWWVQDCYDLGSSIALSDNVEIINSNLNIKVKDNSPSCSGQSSTYSTGFVVSSTHFRYGYFEFRAKFDSYKNIWPAIWLLPSGSTNNYYEIDLMESCATNPTKGYSNIIQENNNDCILDSQDAIHDQQDYNLNIGYNIYGLEWTPNFIKVYINGNLKHTYTNTSNLNPYYHRIILSANVGDYEGCDPTPSSNEFPLNFDVDYFKAYQYLDASFAMKGPDHICINDITEIKWPYYEPFSTYSISLTNGLELVEDPSYASLLDYPIYDPVCQKDRHGVFSFFKVKGVSPGLQTISLNVSFNSGFTKTIHKDIWVGPAVIEGYINSNSYVGPLTNSTMGIASPSCQLDVSLNGANQFNWTYAGGDGSYSTSMNGQSIYVSNLGYINLNVNAQGTCGSSNRSITLFNYGGFYSIAPNPVTNILTITAEKDLYFSSTNDKGVESITKHSPNIQRVKIYGENGGFIKQYAYPGDNKKVTINISELKTGRYLAEIINESYQVKKVFIKVR